MLSQSFVPTGSVDLAATDISSNVAFASIGTNLRLLITNHGPAMAWMKVGDSLVVATSDDTPLFPGNLITIPQGNFTYIAAITASGDASISIVSGTGIPIIVYSIGESQGSSVAFAPLAFEVVTGGVAVDIFDPLPLGGGFITNPLNASESMFVDIVNKAGTIAPGVNGTTVEIEPGASFTIPPGLTSGKASGNAATTGHSFSATGF